VFEILFGGARGGGKTDAVLGEWLMHSDKYRANAIGLMVRRTRVELLETFERARVIYSKIGAEFTGNPSRITMPSGARLTFAYLERDQDADGYQGHSYTRIYVEEAGNFPSAAPIMKLMATLRSGAGVPVGMRLTGNPGGAGHQWVKQRFIDPAPQGWRKLVDPETQLERIFIPSSVQDNTHLGADYVQRLRAVGSPELVKAWLEGDWSVISGAFFPEFSMARHVIAPCALPDHWMRYRSFDWGSARPFSVGWWAVSDGSLPDIARGALVRYREWYGMRPGAPNVGLKLTAEAIAHGILQREADDPGHMTGVADPAIFSEDGGPSIGQRMASQGVVFRPADNKRVARNGAMGGWDQLRARLVGDADERPMLLMFSTCRDLIRTLPAMQHDSARLEDIDTEAEDHAVDECFVAGTMIATPDGETAIERVRVGDLVLTRLGPRPVLAVFTTGDRDVIEVKFSNGRALTGTKNHPIWAEGHGFVSLNTLRYGDMTRPCPRSPLSVRPFRNFWASVTSCAGAIFRRAASACTAWSGRISTAASRAAPTFIIETTTAPITSLITSFVLLPLITCRIMADCAQASLPRFWSSMGAQRQQSGTVRTPVLSGTASIMSGTAARLCTGARRLSAISAERILTALHSAVSAPTPVSQPGAGEQRSMMSSGAVRGVAGRSSPIGSGWGFSAQPSATRPPNQGNMSAWHRRFVATIAAMGSRPQTSAQCGVPTVVGEPTTAGRQRVYNLSVDQAEEYFAEGVLVHNCRYGCMARPYIKDAPVKPIRDSWSRAFDRATSQHVDDWRAA
jgi:hypothetical protein